MDRNDQYSRMVRESGGYDVGTHVPEYDGITPIPFRPVCLEPPEMQERMATYSNLALGKYNGDNNTNYRFVRVVRATYSTGGAKRYYITFQVEDMANCPDSPTVSTFRARLFDGWRRESIVEFCGPEP